MKFESKTLALILSGGAGRRLGGRDKGLVEYQGRTLVSQVFDSIVPQVGAVAISVHRNLQAYQSLCEWVVRDSDAEFEGPIAGIAALLTSQKWASQGKDFEFLVLTPCDTPCIPPDMVSRHFETLINSSAAVAVAHDGERRHNLHCLIKVSALASLLEFFHSGGRALHRWFETQQVADVDFSSQAERFLNINLPQQVVNDI